MRWRHSTLNNRKTSLNEPLSNCETNFFASSVSSLLTLIWLDLIGAINIPSHSPLLPWNTLKHSSLGCQLERRVDSFYVWLFSLSNFWKSCSCRQRYHHCTNKEIICHHFNGSFFRVFSEGVSKSLPKKQQREFEYEKTKFFVPFIIAFKTLFWVNMAKYFAIKKALSSSSFKYLWM